MSALHDTVLPDDPNGLALIEEVSVWTDFKWQLFEHIVMDPVLFESNYGSAPSKNGVKFGLLLPSKTMCTLLPSCRLAAYFAYAPIQNDEYAPLVVSGQFPCLPTPQKDKPSTRVPPGVVSGVFQPLSMIVVSSTTPIPSFRVPSQNRPPALVGVQSALFKYDEKFSISIVSSRCPSRTFMKDETTNGQDEVDAASPLGGCV
jgi:hypothetical protein